MGGVVSDIGHGLSNFVGSAGSTLTDIKHSVENVYQDKGLQAVALAAAGGYAGAGAGGAAADTAAASDAGTLSTAGSTGWGAGAGTASGGGAAVADSAYGPYAGGYQYDPSNPAVAAQSYGPGPAMALSGSSPGVAGVSPAATNFSSVPAAGDSTTGPLASGYGAPPGGFSSDPVSYPSGGGVSPAGGGSGSPSVTDLSRQASPADAATAKNADSTWAEAKSLAKQYGIPLASMIPSLMQRKKPLPQQQQLTDQQQRMTATGNDLISKAQAGQLTPAMQATIDKFKSDALSQAKQYLANSGQGNDSTALQNMQQNIDVQAMGMVKQFTDQMYQEGLQALQIADGATQQLVQLKLGQDQYGQQAMQNFMQAYFAMNGRNQPTTPATA